MKIPKEIAELAAEYEKVKERYGELFKELEHWFSENTGMDDCYIWIRCVSGTRGRGAG